MINCESMHDRIPLVVGGSASWSGEESAHLASCAECAAEWRLVQTARRLGDAAARRVDASAVGRAVLARMATERRTSRWRRGGWIIGLAAAAAIVLVVRGGNWTAPADSADTAAAATALHVPIAELDRLDASELEAVLEGLDEPLGTRAAPDTPHLGDLDDQQLERVLRSLEG